jgi:adenosylmethionine-8-amino-7-oxononanoate aminotransferase
MDIQQLDDKHIWHPYTQYATSPKPLVVKSAEGSLIHTTDGNTIIDAVASWWVNIHGHSNPRLAKAIHDQFLKLEHVIFAGFTHNAATRLAESLLPLLPGQADRLFFSDNGSTAVEVGVKMALQYFHNKEEGHRNQIICFEEGFHGETFGGMSLSGDLEFNKPYESKLFDVHRIPAPIGNKAEQSLKQMEDLLRSGQVAAFLFEPLVLGTAGMMMYSPEVLSKMIALARSYGALCVADEVMTGFGRTGTLFACEQSDEKPDIIAMSKGLTGGSMPMGLTSCPEFVFEAFVSEDKMKTFFHGHSYTGNPLACAVAIESLKMLTEKSCGASMDRIISKHEAFAKKHENNSKFKEIRQCGTILALEYQTEEKTSYFNSRRDRLYDFFIQKGVLLRPLGNVIYILPPYCITDDELDQVYKAIEASLEINW